MITNYEGKHNHSLDLYSISQTEDVSPSVLMLFASEKCINNAPFFAYKKSEKGYGITQGCCNSWTCPRCGIMRAKHEYGRIVEGCRYFASEKEKLYLWTITCRGEDMPLEQAEKEYLKWTNRLLTACRKDSKKYAVTWMYVQVVERQKRGHPHSHIITTWHPNDLQQGTNKNWKLDNSGRWTCEDVETLRSDWLQKRVITAGLGEQYDFQEIRSAEAVSRYTAKYLFKPEAFSVDFPSSFRRVRYSQSFPKLKREKTDAFVLLKRKDWQDLAKKAVVVSPTDLESWEQARENLILADVLIRKPR